MPKDKTIIEIPAGGFYVHDKANKDITPYSNGAFGCCYLTIEDPISGKILIAHINAQTIMFEPIADKTVKSMLGEFKKQGGNIDISRVTIVHSNRFKEYEEAQKKKTKSHELTNSYKEKTPDNMVVEPFANEFLENALKRASVRKINANDKFNSNLAEFIVNPEIGTKKTDICFMDGKVHLQNVQNGEIKNQTPNAEKFFQNVKSNENIISGGDRKAIPTFYLALREGLDTGQIIQNGTQFNFSKTATAELKAKMDDPMLYCINMNEAVKGKQASIEKLKEKPHFMRPTISSLLKEGRDDEALKHSSQMKSQKSFTEELAKVKTKEGGNLSK